ncbi:hypothetical protein DCAR_0209458 [Daucus carota subsp. sativus]|uniref:CCT domain-containing protein n=1 Tax=Daucus carota subsp. sativus TaxID=79200 RepID=A0A166FA12_DAUCS|nr:PREDICTED: uncharacterized protein LOC108208518 [Daucus carota subsp. sativus]WOG90215.1 hypothetical protein DCAR_0209458 [Daucus carota subsp. sativus]
MSSNLFMFDGSIYSDPFSPVNDPFASIDDILQEDFTANKSYQIDEIDQIASTIVSSSPPSHRMGSLSLCQAPLAIEYPNFSVKAEDSQLPFYSTTCGYNNISYSSSFPTYGTDEPVKMMQRSFSSNSFDRKSGFMFQSFDSFAESSSIAATTAQVQALSSPECNSSSNSQMRRFCSTGDLQSLKTSQMRARLSCSPLATESTFMEDTYSKVGRYSAEERKERIHRYRAKRTQRNFNKTIKYACRKTLADNRPRIRGRFARNDEPIVIPKTANYNPYEDEDDLLIGGFFEEENEGPLGRQALLSSYGIQYYTPASN